MEYNTLLNKNQKLKHQKQTGLKGTYNVMNIPDKYSQIGCNTCGLRNHLIDMLIGKQKRAKVRNKLWRKPQPVTRDMDSWGLFDIHNDSIGQYQRKSLKRKRSCENVDPLDKGRLTLGIFKGKIKTADKRAYGNAWKQVRRIHCHVFWSF